MRVELKKSTGLLLVESRTVKFMFNLRVIMSSSSTRTKLPKMSSTIMFLTGFMRGQVKRQTKRQVRTDPVTL